MKKFFYLILIIIFSWIIYGIVVLINPSLNFIELHKIHSKFESIEIIDYNALYFKSNNKKYCARFIENSNEYKIVVLYETQYDGTYTYDVANKQLTHNNKVSKDVVFRNINEFIKDVLFTYYSCENYIELKEFYGLMKDVFTNSKEIKTISRGSTYVLKSIINKDIIQKHSELFNKINIFYPNINFNTEEITLVICVDHEITSFKGSLSLLHNDEEIILYAETEYFNAVM